MSDRCTQCDAEDSAEYCSDCATEGMALATFTMLVSAVAEEYATDSVRAGITVSLLPNGEWYVAVVRYTHAYAAKWIVVSAKSASLEAAADGASKVWLSQLRNPPKRTEMGRALLNRLDKSLKET